MVGGEGGQPHSSLLVRSIRQKAAGSSEFRNRRAHDGGAKSVQKEDDDGLEQRKRDHVTNMGGRLQGSSKLNIHESTGTKKNKTWRTDTKLNT